MDPLLDWTQPREEVKQWIAEIIQDERQREKKKRMNNKHSWT